MGRAAHRVKVLRTCSSLSKCSCPLQEDSSRKFTLFKVSFANLSSCYLRHLSLQAIVVCLFEGLLYKQYCSTFFSQVMDYKIITLFKSLTFDYSCYAHV